MFCDDCKDSNKDDSQTGRCESCTGITSSKDFRLCTGCSRMRGQCRCCRRPIRLGIGRTRLATPIKTRAFVL